MTVGAAKCTLGMAHVSDCAHCLHCFMTYFSEAALLVNVFSFDLQPQFHGMLPVVSGRLRHLQRASIQWPNSLKQCAAVCNSLSLASKGSLVGDPADYSAFVATEATFVVCFAASTWSAC